jgi:hypothetical protein
MPLAPFGLSRRCANHMVSIGKIAPTPTLPGALAA